MAYDKIYFAYYDTSRKYHEINITTGTSASVYTVQYAGNKNDTPATISHIGGSKNDWDTTTIQGQELVCLFYLSRADVDAVTVPLLESTYQEWKVIYTIDSVTDFMGWLKPENIYRRYEKAPPWVEIELAFTDGLSELKDIKYSDSASFYARDRHNLLTYIKYALAPITFELNFTIQLNTYETTSMIDSECVFDKIEVIRQRWFGFEEASLELSNGAVIKIPTERRTLTCWEVLNYILIDFNCKLKQFRGEYRITNYHEKDSYEYYFGWDLVEDSSRTATDNIVDITDYEFSPYIEQQKIHPLASTLITVQTEDIGGDGTGGIDLNDWITYWDFSFSSVTVMTESNIVASGLDKTKDLGAVQLYSVNPGSYTHSMTWKSDIYLNVDDDVATYMGIGFKALLTNITYSSPSPVQVWCEAAIIHPDDEIKDVVSFQLDANMAADGRSFWYHLKPANRSEFRIWKSGNYNVQISFVSSSLGNEWQNAYFYVKDFEFPLFEGLSTDYNPFGEGSISKTYKQVNVGGYESLEVDTILQDDGDVTFVATLQYLESGTLYNPTQWWQPYLGTGDEMRILDLCSRNILINRSKYKNYLRVRIYDKEYNISFQNIVTIEDINYVFSSYTREYKTGWIDAELIELITSFDAAGASSAESSGAYPTYEDYEDYEEEEDEDLKKEAEIPVNVTPDREWIVHQTAHGFNVGDVIRFETDSTVWDGTFYKALADTVEHAMAIGIVSEVLTDDLFRYMSDGYLVDYDVPTRWEPGVYYFLSDVSEGQMEKADTLTPGQIEQCIGFGTNQGFKIEIDARNIQPPIILHGLIEGGNVTWVTGYNYHVGYTKYAIQNEIFEIPYDTVTLSAADVTYDRIDVIAVDDTGDLIVIEGTPAADPQKPYVDPQTQIELSYVLVTASSTEPTGVTGEVIYDENTEWTGSYGDASGFSVDFDSTTSPISGSKCAEATDIENTDFIKFTKGSTINVSEYETISFYIKNKTGGSKKNYLVVYFTNGVEIVCWGKIVNFDKYLTTWQLVTFNISDFSFSNTTVDGFVLKWGNSQDATFDGFYIDRVLLQGGVVQPPTLNDTYTTNLEWTESSETLTLYQNNGREPISVNITLPAPDPQDYLTVASGSESYLEINSSYEISFDDSGITQSYLTIATGSTDYLEINSSYELSIDINEIITQPSEGSPIEYGALYNWWAATDARKITSSDDWVVPTQLQWVDLAEYIDATFNIGDPDYDTYTDEGGKLKETGETFWLTPNTGATNETGFNGRGAGARLGSTGAFTSLTSGTYIWCSDALESTQGKAVSLAYNTSRFYCYNNYSPAKNGNSIRLLYVGAGTPTSYVGNDGKVYRVVTIDTQTWLADNLAETKYRNGDWITGYDGGVYTPISNAAWAALTTEAICYYDDDEDNGGGESSTDSQITALENIISVLTERIVDLEQCCDSVQTITIPSSETNLELNSADELTFVGDTGYSDDWIEFEFRDIESGSVQEYVLDIKARTGGYTIDSVVLQVDTDSMTGVEIQINGTPVTWTGSVTSITATTSVVETSAISANTVSAGNIVTLETSGDSGDTSTLIRGKLKFTRT